MRGFRAPKGNRSRVPANPEDRLQAGRTDPLSDEELESDGRAPSPDDHGDDVRILDVAGRRFYLVGTAHISQHSVDLVRQVIEREQPDCVCVELDQQRYEALSQEKTFETQDLRAIIRNRQLAALLMNLLLASYQKRLGMKLGVTPGKELLEATRTAEENDIPIALCDRDVRITLRRAWSAISFWHKVQLATGVMASAFEDTEISEEELARIRQQDVLSELMRELGEAMPKLKTSLIDERDAYLAHKILNSEGERIVAVVGAGHVEGMSRAIEAEQEIDLNQLESIDPVSQVWTKAAT